MSISVQNISKSFKNKTALSDISFEVKEGELFGLIGPDGAGKTTLFRILTTLLIPNKGEATIANFDIIKDYKSIRNNVGYMPGRFSLYQDLTVEENLEFFATIFGTTIEENYDLIKDIYVQIEPFKKRRAGKLSGGMKQKLALSCALIHKPKVLFLDEPTTGVDPVSRKEFWEMLKRLQTKGITILVSTLLFKTFELFNIKYFKRTYAWLYNKIIKKHIYTIEYKCMFGEKGWFEDKDSKRNKCLINKSY